MLVLSRSVRRTQTLSPKASDSQSVVSELVVRRDGLTCLVVIQNLFQLLALSLLFGFVLGE